MLSLEVLRCPHMMLPFQPPAPQRFCVFYTEVVADAINGLPEPTSLVPGHP
jgi:hypothetical protein